MRLSTRCDTSKGFAALDALGDSILDVAAPRALNTLNEQAQTAGFREIDDVYGVSTRTMAKYASQRTARAGDLEASTSVRGKVFPLSEFRPIQTARGVTVVLKGQRVLVPHAFLVKRFGQHVFARGAYRGRSVPKPTGETGGRGFTYGRTRLPISELYTLGPADMFQRRSVVDRMNDRVDEQAPAVFRREIAAVARGF